MEVNEIEAFLNKPEYGINLGGNSTTQNLDALWLLKNTNKRNDYNRLLSLIIFNALTFNKKELEWLSDFVKKPFIGQKGRPPLDKLKIKIANKYLKFINGNPLIKREVAIKEISKEFKMSNDTARKHLDKAVREYKAKYGI